MPSIGVVELRIALFGQPRVLSADGAREFPLPRKTLHVLAHAILNRRRPSTRDSVAFELFPDEDEEKARNSLRRNLSYLLSAIPDGKRYLQADSERIAWNTEAPAHVDVIAFEAALHDGRDDDALTEYAGQLLPTIYDDWATPDRERLRDAFHEALVRTIARERSERRFDLATAHARRLLEDDPWREDVVRQLMAVRYEAGDRAGALAVFERFAERLRVEMRAEPMPETIALRDAVLRSARLATSEPRRPVAAARSADLTLPFVGRQTAIERARAQWHVAADGRTGLLFVSGEAGSGKSRFVTEFARLIESEGGIVVRGYTSSGGEHRPYESFVEALRETPGLLDDHAGATLDDNRAARVRLFDSVRRRLCELSRTRPLVVVLEDLHWAGAATIDLLEFVLTRLERAPVLLVATVRSDELPRVHPLRALRRQLHSRGSAADVELERLNDHEAKRAARAALPDADEGTIQRVVAWAGGLPLLLAEALRDVAAGRASSAPNMSALLDERFARLTANAETALIFGAVIGERFDLELLSGATGWRDDEIVEAIGESIELGLVRAASRAPGLAFAFTHETIRAAARERISETDRARTHALIARALASQAGESDARAAEIAEHFARAREPVRSAQYWHRAARYALAVFANDDARDAATHGLSEIQSAGDRDALRYDLTDLRERALARIGALDDQRLDARALERLFGAYRDDAVVRRETLAKLAAFAGTSDRGSAIFEYASASSALMDGDFPAARDAALRAAERFERTGDARRGLEARLFHVRILSRLAAVDDAQMRMVALRPVFDDTDDLSLRAEFHRIASSMANRNDPQAQLVDGQHAVELAVRVGDRFTEGRTRHDLAVAYYRLGMLGDTLNEQQRALDAFEDVGDFMGMRDSLFNLVNICTLCGDYPAAQSFLDRLTPEMIAGAWGGHRLALVRGVLHLRSGRFASARDDFMVARGHAQALKIVAQIARSTAYLGEALAHLGDLADARARLDEALATPELGNNQSWLGECQALSAQLHAMTGNLERARADASRCEEIPPFELYSQTAWSLTATYAMLGEKATAQRCAEVGAHSFVEAALHMTPNLIDAYARIWWNRKLIAYLGDQDVALALDTSL
jgi:DNA-binding SARP family transcriptional activator/tetratricopeptide (TPR) repeat protein